MAKVNVRDLSILVGQDGSAVALTADLKCGPGDFAFDGVQENFSAVNDILCNGLYEEATYGAEEPVTATLTVYHDGTLTDSVSGKPLDFVLQTGAYASTGTTVDPGGTVWKVDVIVTFVKNGIASTMRFNTVRLTASYATTAEANTITLSMSARGRPGRAPLEVS